MNPDLKCVVAFLFGLFVGGTFGFFFFAWFTDILRKDRRDPPRKSL